MIDKKLAEKPIHFECSIGNAGNVLDGYNPPSRKSPGHDSDDSDQGSVAEDSDEPSITMDTPKWKSTTTPQRPVTRDRYTAHL